MANVEASLYLPPPCRYDITSRPFSGVLSAKSPLAALLAVGRLERGLKI